MIPLIAFAEQGNLDSIARELDAGVDIDIQDESGRTAAMAATYANQVDAARLLFNRGANPDIQDDALNNPFLYAGAEGNLQILKLASEAGADPTITNRFGGTALIPACERGHIEVVTYLLGETDVDVDHVNNLGWTALLEAIILNDGGPNQQAVIRILIDHGADVDLADGDGVTPLEHALRSGFGAIERILVEAGATGRATRRRKTR